MSLVHARLLVRVAGYAREHGVVGRVSVAIAACGPGSRVRAGINREPGVVESRSQPGRSVVTQRARRRELCRDVVGIVRAQIIRLVTRVAVSRRVDVVVVDMATGARDLHVEASQRELGFVVIEGRGLPRRGAVTDFASGREAYLKVRRIVRALVVLQVARRARWVQLGELPVPVTSLALQVSVCSR